MEGVSTAHLRTHETFEMAATMFHISIAVVAISVVAKRREFWILSILGGAVGLYFLGNAYAHQPLEHEQPAAGQYAPTLPGNAGDARYAPAGGHAPAAETGTTH